MKGIFPQNKKLSSNIYKKTKKNSSKAKRIKLRKIRRRPNNISTPLLFAESVNIDERGEPFGSESTTREKTSVYLSGVLRLNDLSLPCKMYFAPNGFKNEEFNIDEKINNFNVDNYNTNF